MTEEQPTSEADEQSPAPGSDDAAAIEQQLPVEASDDAGAAAPAEEEEAAEPALGDAGAASPAEEAAAEPVPGDAAAPAQDDARRAPESQVGPKILGVAPEPKPLPVVKKKLDLRPPKPPREPLPWPELREAVDALKQDLKTEDLKELFRLLPTDVRDEVVTGVREFRKGARRPVSAFAAKSLARSVHTARRMKSKAEPSAAVTEALGQAMAAETIASLEVEQAAEVILPKRDLIEREARTARRRQRDEEDKAKEEFRRQRREAGKAIKQTSFGEFTGPKIKGIEALAGLFSDEQAAADGPAEEPQGPAAEVPQPATPDVPTAPADVPAPQPPSEAPGVVPDAPSPDVVPEQPGPEIDPTPAEPPAPEQPDDAPEPEPEGPPAPEPAPEQPSTPEPSPDTEPSPEPAPDTQPPPEQPEP